MTRRTFESEVPASRQEVFDWHTRPGAFERLAPPWQAIRLEESAPIEDGSRVRLSLKKGPFRFAWIAEHRDVRPGQGFTDFQAKGPFASWTHTHEFRDAGTGSILSDTIDYELPMGSLGGALGGSTVAKDLSSTFAYRHQTTIRDLARHEPFLPRPRLRVAVSGASGLLGGTLLPFLTTGGHEVLRLVRGPAETTDTLHWNPESGLATSPAAESLDAVVHLAGESIAGGRWTAARKDRILSSRTDGTRNLVHSLGRLRKPPRVLVCASAIGWYGSRGDEQLDERSAPGTGFLAQVCQEWEEAAQEAAQYGIRVVMLRFGVILTPKGGALAKMLPPFRMGAGGRIGSGRQYMSWVSIDDTIAAIHHALQVEELSGPINVVAPNPVTNTDFTRALGRVLHRPTIAPLPAFVARAVFGEMADEMLLSSARVAPRALTNAGFAFDDAELEPALARLLGRVAWT